MLRQLETGGEDAIRAAFTALKAAVCPAKRTCTRTRAESVWLRAECGVEMRRGAASASRLLERLSGRQDKREPDLGLRHHQRSCVWFGGSSPAFVEQQQRLDQP